VGHREASQELRAFLSAFDPAIKGLFIAVRRRVLAAAPDADELVYDAYNAVSCAYTYSGRLEEAFCHVAAYRGWVNLGFNRGADLRDPARILVGTGARIRHVRIAAPADLRAPALHALLRAAVAQGRALAPRAARARPVAKIRRTTGPKRRPGRA
jgi:hypothetical protein